MKSTSAWYFFQINHIRNKRDKSVGQVSGLVAGCAGNYN